MEKNTKSCGSTQEGHLIWTGVDQGMFSPKGQTNIERNSMSFTILIYEIVKILLSKQYKEVSLPPQVEVGGVYIYIHVFGFSGYKKQTK